MADNTGDTEAQKKQTGFSYASFILDQGVLPPGIENHQFEGNGTEEDPYVVRWMESDPRNPLGWSKPYKWFVTLVVAFATLTVSFSSSAYSGGIENMLEDFHTSQISITLGLSMFVLGFAIGPLLWAPLSEMYGRQLLYAGTFGAFAAFSAGAAGANSVTSLIITRFFAGAFGSSPLTNSGGVIADMFHAKDRGLAMSIFAVAPFMGPVLGPIVAGFLGEAAGWRWVLGLLAAYCGLMWVLGMVFVPETYAPVLLRRRAEKLSAQTGKVYRSTIDIHTGKKSILELYKIGLSRPWKLLFLEPIVLILSIYQAIIYGILYLLFGAFPIVYRQQRHWSNGISGLAFLGLMVGMALSIIYIIFVDDYFFQKTVHATDGQPPPEARLPSLALGGVVLPIGLFWFAWTNGADIHWLVSITAGVPFGFGMVLIFLAGMNYLVDSYVIFAASVLAASAVLRAVAGCAFPLFTKYMYDDLGIHWASSVPAFLSLACVPFPFLFMKYGESIRKKCKYAAEADAFVQRMRQEHKPLQGVKAESKAESKSDAEVEMEMEMAAESEEIELEGKSKE